MALGKVVGRWLSHTRFVPTPLYRLMLIAAMISGVLQLVYGAPAAVTDAAGNANWFDWTFVLIQLGAAVLTFWGLYLVEGENAPPWVSQTSPIMEPDPRTLDPGKLHRSLTMELIGLFGLQTAMALQIVSQMISLGRVPSSMTVWMGIVFWTWAWFRVRDIVRAVRKLTRKPRA
jgi:hypothetical protein